MDFLHGPRTPTLVTDVSKDTTKKKERQTDRQTEKEHPPAPGQKLPPTEKHTRSSTNDSQDSEGGVSGSHGKPDGGGRKWDEDGKLTKMRCRGSRTRRSVRTYVSTCKRTVCHDIHTYV